MRFATCRSLEGIKPSGKRVAIIGAGPAGLAAAGVLICKGHEVHVYDKLPEPGGMLIFAIPEFRIPKAGVRAGIEELRQLGVKFYQNVEVGRDVPLAKLKEEYDAVIVATGTWKSRRLGIPGEDLPHVYDALEWIFHFMKYKLKYEKTPPPSLDGKVGVIGAGLTAADICELAVKEYGAEAYILYRRSKEISPARHMIRELEKIGVKFVEFVRPLEILGEKKAEQIKLIKVTPTKSRKEPVHDIPGTEFTMSFDNIVVAIGLYATPPESIQSLGIETYRNGAIKVDEHFMTNVKGVFAAGDVQHGPSNIGMALKSGKDVAKYVDMYLHGLL